MLSTLFGIINNLPVGAFSFVFIHSKGWSNQPTWPNFKAGENYSQNCWEDFRKWVEDGGKKNKAEGCWRIDRYPINMYGLLVIFRLEELRPKKLRLTAKLFLFHPSLSTFVDCIYYTLLQSMVKHDSSIGLYTVGNTYWRQ